MLFETGDLVLLRFPFTGQTGDKQRPAPVLLDAGDDDLLVARVTTHRYASRFDCAIENWMVAGLLAPSTVRLHKLATFEKSLVRRKLGHLDKLDWVMMRPVLSRIFGE